MNAIAQRDRLIQRQSLVMRLATQVLNETSTQKALTVLVDATYKVVDCERVSLFMIEEGYLVCCAAPQGGRTGWRTPLGQGIAGHVGKTGTTVNLADAYDRLDIFDPSHDVADKYKTQSVLAVPIKDRGEIIGVLQATNKADYGQGGLAEFDSTDEQLLQVLLELTAQQLRVFEIMQTYQQAHLRNQTTIELVEAICWTQQLDEALQAVARATRAVVRCQLTLVLLEDQGDLVCRAKSGSWGSRLLGMRLSRSDVIVGSVLSEGRAMLFEEGVHDRELSEFHHHCSSAVQNGDGPVSGRARVPVFRSALCCPLTPESGSLGVIVALNRELQDGEPSGGSALGLLLRSRSLNTTDRDSPELSPELGVFRPDDVEQVSMLLRLAGHFVKSSRLYESEVRTTNRFKALVSLLSDAKDALESSDTQSFARLILAKSIVMFECDRCTFFTVDSLNSEFLGYFIAEGSGELQELRVPIMGIAGCAANTRQLLNIRDAWSDKRFSNQTDLRTGYRTRTLLCAPLTSSTGKVIAVLQCVNKKQDEIFSADDEKMLYMVSCLLSDLLQSMVTKSSYESFITSNQVDSDVKDLFREWNGQASEGHKEARPQRQSSVGITREFELMNQDSNFLDKLRRWDFDVGKLVYQDSKKLTAVSRAFFGHFGLLSAFCIAPGVLDGFVEAMRPKYCKHAAYHNWAHAFTTLHATFLLLDSWSLYGLLPEADILGLLIAALGHDVEHPGYTNTFLVNTRHSLALRYNDIAVLESHHASITCQLLEQGMGPTLPSVCEGMPPEVAKRLRLVIVTSILGTDMVKHQECITKLESSKIDVPQLKTEGSQLGADDALHLGAAILHSADLVHPTLPWRVHKERSQLIATEFFQQFEEEMQLGLPTLPFMGKDPNSLQQLAPIQVGFIQFVAAPLWSAMNFYGGLDRLVHVKDNIEQNRRCWQQLVEGQAIDEDQPFQNPHNSDMRDFEDN